MAVQYGQYSTLQIPQVADLSGRSVLAREYSFSAMQLMVVTLP